MQMKSTTGYQLKKKSSSRAEPAAVIARFHSRDFIIDNEIRDTRIADEQLRQTRRKSNGVTIGRWED